MPNVMSTPCVNVFENNFNKSEFNNNVPPVPIKNIEPTIETLVVGETQEHVSNQSICIEETTTNKSSDMSQSFLPQTSILVSDNQNNIMQVANIGGVLYQTGGVFQMPSMPQYIIQVPPKEQLETKHIANLTDDFKTLQCTSKIAALERRYAYLNDLKPPENLTYCPQQHHGFSEKQRALLEQQLRMHVQMLAQNFLQTYGHPGFFAKADKFFQKLVELENHALLTKNMDTSIWNIINLKFAVDCCRDWMKDLENETPENTHYIE